jgi:2-acylglycerol O-acyltransferase 2
VVGKQTHKGEKGLRYRVLQAIAWNLYGVAVLVYGYLMVQAARRVPAGISLVGTALGVASQYVVLASLRYYEEEFSASQGSAKKFGLLLTAPGTRVVYGICKDIYSHCMVASFYAMPAIAAVVMALPMVLWGLKILPIWMGILYAYNNFGVPLPEKNGSRTWQAFRRVYGACEAAEHYFSLKIWRSVCLPETKQYMFAFHPHGIYPLTIYWSTQGNRWRSLFPNIDIVPVCATVIFRLPVMRDICLWLGLQDVSKESIHNVISAGKSLIIVPGGEREMRVSSSDTSKIKIVTKHKGFIRIALERGVSLVPVFSFGENLLLDNISLPVIQEWFQKKIFYGFPHFPYGRWFSPVPNQVSIEIAVGEPIHVPKIENPSQDLIDHYHNIYFQSLQDLFDSHKTRIPGFENSQLHLLDQFQ